MGKTMGLTTPLTQNDAVKAVQRLLAKAGYFHGTVDGVYGPLTAQAVYRAKYWIGYPKPDHYAGDQLYGFLDGSRKPPVTFRTYASLRRRKAPPVSSGSLILSEAQKHLGTRESPPDSNQVLFSRWYGMIGSWCAMFVSYCGVKAGLKAFKQGHYYAYVPYVVADARAGRNNLTLQTAATVMPGDLVCFDWPGESPGIADHIGIFEKWIEKGKTFSAIEGNTSLGNNSNGGEVMRRERDVSLVQVFVRAH